MDRLRGNHVHAALAQEVVDLQHEFQAVRRADRRRFKQLRWCTRVLMRAIRGGKNVRNAEEWQAACEDAAERYQSGRFLLERLGMERFLDPPLLATLGQLHQSLVAEYSAELPA